MLLVLVERSSELLPVLIIKSALSMLVVLLPCTPVSVPLLVEHVAHFTIALVIFPFPSIKVLAVVVTFSVTFFHVILPKPDIFEELATFLLSVLAETILDILLGVVIEQYVSLIVPLII